MPCQTGLWYSKRDIYLFHWILESFSVKSFAPSLSQVIVLFLVNTTRSPGEPLQRARFGRYLRNTHMILMWYPARYLHDTQGLIPWSGQEFHVVNLSRLLMHRVGSLWSRWDPDVYVYPAANIYPVAIIYAAVHFEAAVHFDTNTHHTSTLHFMDALVRKQYSKTKSQKCRSLRSGFQDGKSSEGHSPWDTV
jgi:hypothetical protein